MLYGRLTKGQWEVVALIRSWKGKALAKRAVSNFTESRTKTHGGGELKWKTVSYDDDSIIEKVGFDFVFDDEDWEEFHDSYYLHTSGCYDCTGKLFTVWMKRFTVNGKTIIYRKNAIDF